MKRLTSRAIAAITLGCAVAVATIHSGGGCAQNPLLVPVRSLERSGQTSFVCLDRPGTQPRVERPLIECTQQQVSSISEYCTEDDAGDIDAGSLIPHLYALVTQTTRGEVAVVDTTSNIASVLDENPREPGANFLPVGAQPTGIVSTPGSVATFVGSAALGGPGLYALPSESIRPGSTYGNGVCGLAGFGGTGVGGFGPALPAPQITSWAACSLPSAPGYMILVDDPAVGGAERPSCDAQYAQPAGALTVEGQGRQKLVVSMPDLGGVAVIDAEDVYDRAVGSFDPCTVERWLPLKVDLTGLAELPAPYTGPACTNPAPGVPPLASSYTPRPAELTYADGVLYVADEDAPVIHVIAMPTPCDLAERAPLLPTSAETPARVVTTNRIAVAPQLTPTFKRYLYATDVYDDSLMVFDVGPSSTSRRPLTRVHPEWDPLQPRDRIRLGAPAADIIVVQHDIALGDPTTGVAVGGVFCDPNPALCSDACTLTVCDPLIPSTCFHSCSKCDIATQYRTDATYSSGAGPLKLRGEFAFAALTNGKVAVIDVEDFDAPCRVPEDFSTLNGCGTEDPVDVERQSANEMSCNMVIPNTLRTMSYEAYTADSSSGNQLPGIATFPVLYRFDGTLVDITDPASPIMVPTKPDHTPVSCTLPDQTPQQLQASYGCPLSLFVGGVQTGVLAAPGVTPSQHALLMNLEDPHAQLANESWTVTYEGPLPGFDQQTATFQPAGAEPGLYDPNSAFCSGGVLSENAWREMLLAEGEPAATIDALAPQLADYVQIVLELPLETDVYWNNPARGACDFSQCLQDFGTFEAPTLGRDLRIVEAFQDHLDLEYRQRHCTPRTCADQGISCGPAGDGCGAELSCGTCKATETCGGGGVLGACGAGGTCVPRTCKDAGAGCGPVGDGCGHVLQCGSCASPETCGGGGAPGVCGQDLAEVNCCFNLPMQYNVRAGQQWVAVGSQSGFLHNVVADAVTGVCRNSCDPIGARRNGRIREAPSLGTPAGKAPIGDGQPDFAFINPSFRFAITQGNTGGTNAKSQPSQRDMQFRFTTLGAFAPLFVPLSTDPTVLVQPAAIAYLPGTGEIVVTDGATNGVIFVSLTTSAVTRSYF